MAAKVQAAIVIPYWSDDCKMRSRDKNRTIHILVRIKGNTSLRSKYRRLKGVAQAVMKNAARDHFRDFCSTLDRVSSSSKPFKNAPKCTILNIKFQNFLGGDTPEPPLLEGATPSRTHPPDDLRRFAPPVVRRPLRGRLLGP